MWGAARTPTSSQAEEGRRRDERQSKADADFNAVERYRAVDEDGRRRRPPAGRTAGERRAAAP